MGPFNVLGRNAEICDTQLAVGPALLVREQRARAARLYNNVVTWSLWYAHTDGMLTDGWIVDVDKCVGGCKFYYKFKTCCHIIVGRKAKRLPRPGVEDKTEKLVNRQIRKTSGSVASKRKMTSQQASNPPASTSVATELPLAAPLLGRPLPASRALDKQYILSPDT
jgi:hypothetical protein